MHVRAEQHAVSRAAGHVDMRIGAALADDPKLMQAIEKRAGDARSLANQNQGFSIG